MKQSNTMKRLGTGLLVTVVLCGCLFGTTFSLRPAYAELKQAPAASLNGGEPVIDMEADEQYFEPGMTIEKLFYIKNLGTTTVNYGFYFTVQDAETPLSGALAETLEVTILKKQAEKPDWILATGTMAEMTNTTAKRVTVYGDSTQCAKLEISEQIDDITLRIHYPKSAGREGMGKTLDFNFCLGVAEATQAAP